MVVKVGMNSGHIDRSILQTSLKHSNTKVTVINDAFKTLHSMVDKVTWDSAHGRHQCSVFGDRNQLFIDGQPMVVCSERDPVTIPWTKLGVDHLVETTSVSNGAFICTHSVNSLLYGIRFYKPRSQVIFNASDTAKMVDSVWEDRMTMILSTMVLQKMANANPNEKHQLVDCSTVTDTILTCNNATEVTSNTIRNIDEVLAGYFFRVLDPDISVLDCVNRLEKSICYNEIKTTIKGTLEDDLHGMIGYCQDEMVSTDLVGDTHSSQFDPKSGISLDPYFIKTNAWYNSTFGDYSARPVIMIPQVA